MDERERYFAQLYRRHYDLVVRYLVRRMVGDHVHDVAAEVFLVVWRRIDDVPRGDPALPWIYGVARRTLANETRGSLRLLRAVERVRAGTERASGDHAGDVADRLAVAEAFNLLGEADREVLRLAVWEGLSVQKAARSLECTRQAYLMRLHRARKRLKANIERTFDDRSEPDRTRDHAQTRTPLT